ncbi:hypothetical protein MML48_2g00003457 [Holotrichia oblita]|uniref:Uncharacterized protein n=1 Tax=Holotrichia oblita TaxID=644536 RepID=A0ACB9TI48_HOLOL|nr:hypothetical protein MML48_2g00003457 [Holotrichia oblita]
MPRIAFEFLLETIDNHKDQMLGGDHFKIPLKKQLLAVIWLLATPDSYRSVGERFNLSKSSLSVCFFRIIDILNQLANTFIKWPNAQQREATKNNFENKYKLRGVIGAIDGCYIPMKAPADQKLAYTNRKCFTAVTLQAVCDNNLRYLDCFIGFPSSVHDSRIFRNSELYLKITTNVDTYFNEEEKIIADKAYPVESWCIPPFINRGNLTQQQTYFNTRHAQCRSVIERSFALLFGRFRRLRYIDMNRFDFVPATILAACVLHNACLDHGNEFIEEYIDEGYPHAIRNNPGEDQEGMIWNYGDRQRARGNGFIERNHMMQDLWQNRRQFHCIIIILMQITFFLIIFFLGFPLSSC